MAVETVTVDRRVYVTADGEAVGESDGRSKRLLCIPGDELERSVAERYGVAPDPSEPEPAEDEVEPEPEPATHMCEDCGYVSPSAAGLGAHRRKHKTEDAPAADASAPTEDKPVGYDW